MVQATEIQPIFSVSDAPPGSPAARRCELRCPHGVSSAVLLAGGPTLGDQVLLDIVRGLREHGVGAGAAVQVIVAGIAGQRVVAGKAIQVIVEDAPGQRIVARGAGQGQRRLTGGTSHHSASV